MATQSVAMPPNNLIDPHHRHPDRRAEGPERRDPFKQPFHKAPDAKPQHSLQWGANVDLEALDAIPQPTGRPMPCRNSISGVAARRLKNGFLGCAVLCYAPHRFARNDGDGATRHTTTDRMNSTQGQDKPQRITETTEPTWGTPDCLCALCALCGKPHAPRGTAHPTDL